MPEANKSRFLAEPEDLDEKIGQSAQVPFPKLADREVQVPVGGDYPEGHIFMGSSLDLAGADHPCAVAVEKKRLYHPRLVGRVPSSISLAGGVGGIEIKFLDHIDDEMG